MSVIVNGIGPTSGASALGDLTDIGTMGEPIAQADNLTEVVTAMGGASAVRTAIDAAEDGAAPSVTSEVMAGSGWSSSGSGTHSETWDGTKLDLAITSSAGTAAVSKADVLPAGDEYDVLLRFSMPTNNNAPTEQLYVAVGSASNKNTALAIKSNGGFDASRTNSGYVSIASPGGGPTGSQLTDGQSWLRLAKRAGTFCWYWGRGSAGARPLSEAWVLVTTPSTNTAVLEAAAGLDLYLGAITDVSATVLFRVHAIQHCRPGAL